MPDYLPWTGQGRAGQGRAGQGRAGLRCAGLGWAGLGWDRLGWARLGWSRAPKGRQGRAVQGRASPHRTIELVLYNASGLERHDEGGDAQNGWGQGRTKLDLNDRLSQAGRANRSSTCYALRKTLIRHSVPKVGGNSI